MTAHPTPRAFSLIELLVVIAIISVLLALLTPTLSKARDTAKATTCMTQERQILIAFSGYLEDWKRTYPYSNPARPGFINDWGAAYCYPWTRALSKYLGEYRISTSVPILNCPSNPWPAYVSNNQNNPPSSYAMSIHRTAFPTNWHDSGSPVSMVPARREFQLLQPSKTLLIGEVPNAASAYGRSFANAGVEYVSFMSAATYSSPNPVGYWYTPDIAGRPAGNPIARVNHDLAWNSGMADGSVKRSTKNQLRTWADQYSGLVAASEGLMFWGNRRN